jgi:hypothetical protein
MRQLDIEELHRLRNKEPLPRVKPAEPIEAAPVPAGDAPTPVADPFGD